MALDFSLQSQLEKCAEILRRDLSYLMTEASKGKLSAPSARDLVAYIKLLNDLKDLEKDDLNKLSDEALEALANGSDNKASSPIRTGETQE